MCFVLGWGFFFGKQKYFKSPDPWYLGYPWGHEAPLIDIQQVIDNRVQGAKLLLNPGLLNRFL